MQFIEGETVVGQKRLVKDRIYVLKQPWWSVIIAPAFALLLWYGFFYELDQQHLLHELGSKSSSLLSKAGAFLGAIYMPLLVVVLPLKYGNFSLGIGKLGLWYAIFGFRTRYVLIPWSHVRSWSFLNDSELSRYLVISIDVDKSSELPRPNWGGSERKNEHVIDFGVMPGWGNRTRDIENKLVHYRSRSLEKS